MPILTNKNVYKQRIADSISHGDAFWMGALIGYITSYDTNAKMESIIETVFDKYLESNVELNSNLIYQIQKDLESQGVGINEEAIKDIWEGYELDNEIGLHG